MGSIERNTNSLVEIASRISANILVVNKALQSRGLKTPTFGQETEENFPNLEDDPEAVKAREALLDDSKALYDLTLGAADVVRQLCWNSMNVSVLRIIYHFKIFEAIPLAGGATYTEIAAKVNLPEHRLKSVIRQAALNRVFAEDSPNHVVHTASSAILIQNKSMQDWVGHFVEEVFPTSAKLVEAIEAHPGSEEPSETAFSVAFNTGAIFKYFDENVDRQARFFGAMAGVGKSFGLSVQHIIRGYGWGQLGKALVVDVGGSSGFVSSSIADAYPDLTFEVQDLKHTVEQGALGLAPRFASQVKFVPHDFFTAQPTTGDIYLLRHICHDWSSKYASKILQAIVPAMKPTSKIVLIESVVAPPGTTSTLHERTVRNMDLNMFQMLNSQERTREDWEGLLEKTDPRLVIKSIHQPKGSWDSIIEVGFR